MRSLLIASFLIIVAAVSAPGFLTQYAQQVSVAEVTPDAGASEPQEKPKSSGPRQVEIRAARDGHFYVDAQVNFRPVRLIVDTGATVVALRASDAATAGIRVHESDFRHPVQTANGTTMAAEIDLESVSVDYIEVRRVRALVIPDDQLSMSLLGGSFLHGLERFEVADGTLIFEN